MWRQSRAHQQLAVSFVFLSLGVEDVLLLQFAGIAQRRHCATNFCTNTHAHEI